MLERWEAFQLGFLGREKEGFLHKFDSLQIFTCDVCPFRMMKFKHKTGLNYMSFSQPQSYGASMEFMCFVKNC